RRFRAHDPAARPQGPHQQPREVEDARAEGLASAARCLHPRVHAHAEEAELERKTGGDPVATLKRAVENVRPALEVKSRRVGGATYQVPVEVRPRRATALAVRWVAGA